MKLGGFKLKKNKMLFLPVLLSAIVMLSSATTANVLSNERQNSNLTESCTSAKWTVMIYFACDNARHTLTDESLEMLTDIGSNDDVNIVALVDGKVEGDTIRYHIHQDLLEPLLWYDVESDMSDPLTFQRFLELTKFQYPANHYALFTLSAWGSGWQGAFSDTHGTGGSKTLSVITMPEVSEVLKKITDDGSEKLDVWGIDVCVPGMVEVAYEIAPYVDYMVANEEHGFEGDISEEGYELGWNYTHFLQELKNNPDMSPEDFSILIVDCYQAGTRISKLFKIKITPPKWYPITIFYSTLSAIDLSKIDQINTSLNTLASKLKDNLEQVKPEIKNARAKTREYGKLYRKFWWLPIIIVWLQIEPLGYDGFIDLYDFVDKLKNETTDTEIQNSCIMVMDALDEIVIANEALPNDPSYGLSIYFPKLRCQYDQSLWRGGGNPEFNKIPSPYENLQFSQDNLWDEFLREYLKI